MTRYIVARVEGTSYGGRKIVPLEGQCLRCPWHGWAYDITTGEAVFEAIAGASAVTIGAAYPDAVGQ